MIFFTADLQIGNNLRICGYYKIISKIPTQHQ